MGSPSPDAGNRGFVELQAMGGAWIVPVAFLLLTLVIAVGAIVFRTLAADDRRRREEKR